jgi:hypothetical protein
MCTCRKRAAGGVKSPNGVTVWQETLDWQACAQVQQIDRGWPATLGAIVEQERKAEISR